MLAVYFIFYMINIVAGKLSNSYLDDKRPIDHDFLGPMNELYPVEQRKNGNIMDKFVPFLLNISIEILQNVENNIKNNYGLNYREIEIITRAFNLSNFEYYVTLKNNLKWLMDIDYVSEELFLLDFTDFSNLLLQSIVENNMNKIDERNFKMPYTWYRHLPKHTILRQQIKIAINLVELKLCFQLKICVDKTKYTEYVVEYLRLLMNVDVLNLKHFFYATSELLLKLLHTNESNPIFEEKVKNSVYLTSTNQRYLLDFLDEIIIERNTVVAVHPPLKRFVLLLRELFDLIDNNYQMNYINVWKMNRLHRMFFQWTQYKSFLDIREIMHGILINIQNNIQIWPHNAKNRFEEISLQIIRNINTLDYSKNFTSNI